MWKLPARRLWSIVVIVWGIGLLAFVAAAPTLFAWDISYKPLLDALTAFGTIGAAGVALWIATSDRRARTHERDVADHAQARLVIVDVVPVPTTPNITVSVKNYGDRSILDVTYESVEAQDSPSARFTPQLRWVNVVEPNRDNPDGTLFDVRPADEPTRVFMQGRWVPTQQGSDPGPTIPLDVPLAATVRFTDANGNRWQTTFELRGRRAIVADGSVVTVGSMRHVTLIRVLVGPPPVAIAGGRGCAR